jgi:hypothetical protein
MSLPSSPPPISLSRRRRRHAVSFAALLAASVALPHRLVAGDTTLFSPFEAEVPGAAGRAERTTERAEAGPRDPRLDAAEPIFTPGLPLAEIAGWPSYHVTLPGGAELEIVPTRKQVYFGRYLAVFGELRGELGDSGEAAFVYSDAGLVADLFLADGHWSTLIADGGSHVVDARRLAPDLASHCGVAPSGSAEPAAEARDGSASPFAAGKAVAGLGNSELNLALVLSQTHGLSQAAVTSAIETVNLANLQFAWSNVPMHLNPALITRVDPELDVDLNVDASQTAQLLAARGFEVADLQYPGRQVPSGATTLPIHQLALYIGPGADSTVCGVTPTPPRGTGQLSVVRVSGCPDSLTLAHELGHNMTLVHSDGVKKTYQTGDMTRPKVWRSVMTSGVGPGQIKRYFTGGTLYNVFDPDICGGTCNVAPFADHDSIGRLLAVRGQIENLFTIVDLTPADAWDDYSLRPWTDDVPGDAAVLAAGDSQDHNVHDQGDEDWTIFALGAGGAVTVSATPLGYRADPDLYAYRVDGPYPEIEPGRWAIDPDDLTLVAASSGPGSASVYVPNTSGEIEVFVVKAISWGAWGAGTEYRIGSAYAP